MWWQRDRSRLLLFRSERHRARRRDHAHLGDALDDGWWQRWNLQSNPHVPQVLGRSDVGNVIDQLGQLSDRLELRHRHRDEHERTQPGHAELGRHRADGRSGGLGSRRAYRRRHLFERGHRGQIRAQPVPSIDPGAEPYL
jgi:hypothetical protein